MGFSDSDFLEISISVFARIEGALPFNVYVRRSAEAYTRLFPKGEPIDVGRLTAYQVNKGLERMYVTREDYREYSQQVEKMAEALFANERRGSPGEVLDMVKELANLTLLEMMVNRFVDHVSIAHAQQTIKGCLNLLSRDPKTLMRIFQLMATHPYMMRHSVQVTIFSLMIARLESFESDRTLMIIGMGAMLHDIGMAMLPFDPDEKSELNPGEWREVKEHPQLGRKMLEPLKSVPTEVRLIVSQHHEQPNGMGYPNGLHDKQIYYPAKIVAVADAFSALTSQRPFRGEPNTPARAFELMFEERGKYDVKILERFAALFGVKKPENLAA